MIAKQAQAAQAQNKPKEGHVFSGFLESVKGTLSEYTVEILQDMLFIKSKKGKVNLQLNVRTISPLFGGCETLNNTDESKEQESEAT